MSTHTSADETNAEVILPMESSSNAESAVLSSESVTDVDTLSVKALPTSFSNVGFTLPAKQARDAWRAVAAVKDRDDFCLFVSEDCIRFSAAANGESLDVEYKLDPSLKPRLGATQLSFDIETKGLAALGVIDTEGDVTFKFPEIDLAVGSTGAFIITVADAFTVNWDYVLTAATPVGQPPDERPSDVSEEGRPIDPRVLRKVISRLRDFTAEENVMGSDYTAVQVGGGAARAGIHGAGCEIISTEIKDISFSVERKLAGSINTLLGILAPERTTLCSNEERQKLTDGQMTISVKQGEYVPALPKLQNPVAQMRSDGFVFDEALTRIRAQIKNQKRTDDVVVEMVLSPDDQTLTFATEVNGGVARVAANVTAGTGDLTPTSLKFFNYLFEKLDVEIQTVVEIAVFKNAVSFIQDHDKESYRTLIAPRREKQPEAQFVQVDG